MLRLESRTAMKLKPPQRTLRKTRHSSPKLREVCSNSNEFGGKPKETARKTGAATIPRLDDGDFSSEGSPVRLLNKRLFAQEAANEQARGLGQTNPELFRQGVARALVRDNSTLKLKTCHEPIS